MKPVDERREIEAQVMREIYLEIGRGAYRPGEALPSPEDLGRRLLVNPHRIVSVYDEICRRGIAERAQQGPPVIRRNGAEKARAQLLDDFAADLGARIEELRKAGCSLPELRKQISLASPGQGGQETS